MKTKEKPIKLSLSQKLLALFFILLVIDFIFYLIFGQNYSGSYSLGRSIFVIISILDLLVFLALLIALAREFAFSFKKKSKKNSI